MMGLDTRAEAHLRAKVRVDAKSPLQRASPQGIEEEGWMLAKGADITPE